MATRLVPVVLVVVILGGCDSQREQDEFAQRALLSPSGFTHTDADANIVIGDDGEPLIDEDDWREAPRFGAPLGVDPAYPNPASTELISIPVTIRFSDTVRGLYLNLLDTSTGRLVPLDAKPEATQTGTYVFTISPAEFPRKGLHRVILFDGRGEIVSYGDIMAE